MISLIIIFALLFQQIYTVYDGTISANETAKVSEIGYKYKKREYEYHNIKFWDYFQSRLNIKYTCSVLVL